MRRLALILAVGIVPLVVYNAADMHPAAEFARFTGGSFVTDMFFLPKARLLWGVGVLAGISIAWRGANGPWFALALMFLAAISAVISPYSWPVATMGSPWHYEGIAVILAYLVLCIAAAGHYRLVFRTLSISCLAVTTTVVMERMGYPYPLVAPDWLMGLDGMPVAYKCCFALSGTFGNSNHLGTYAATVFPFFLALSVRRWVFVPLAAAGFYILWESQSRGAFLGAAFGCLAVLALAGWWTRAVVVAGAAFLLPVRAIADHVMAGGSGRAEIWRHTLPMLRDTWLIGRGPGAFPLDYPGPQWGETFIDRPHNLYMQVWHHSGGIAALILIGAIVYYCVRSMRSREPNAIALCAGVVGYSVSGMFNDSTPGVGPVFWVLLGLLARAESVGGQGVWRVW